MSDPRIAVRALEELCPAVADDGCLPTEEARDALTATGAPEYALELLDDLGYLSRTDDRVCLVDGSCGD